MTRQLPVLESSACCADAPESPGLDSDAARDAAAVFKALGDPTRVRLLSLIAARQEGEACICDLTEPVGLSQPTVSHHMSTLAKAGLVTREQRGKWAYFSVAPGARELVDGALSAALGTQRAAR